MEQQPNMLQLNPDLLQDGLKIPKTGENSNKAAYDNYLLTGFLLIFTMVTGFILWTVLAPIQGAVIAAGTVVVEGKPKTLQHLDGGIVSDILVSDGDKVSVGDVLLRLDPTSLNANRDLIQKRLDEATAFHARLTAERDSRSYIPWKTVFPSANRTPNVDMIIKDQTQLFKTRRSASQGQLAQLQKRLQQSEEQILGFQSQSAANQSQLDIILKELEGLRELFKDGYVSQTRILALEREQAGLSGQISGLQAEIARTRTVMGETEIEILQVTRLMQEAVLTELRVKESEISDLKEQLISASDQAGRVDVIAPVSGTIHNMAISTLGGVITPANPIMDIIPDTDRLIVESKVEPMYVDQIYSGQDTTVRLSAFNQRTTPELNGKVISISANTTIDPVTSLPFYTVRIEIPTAELSRLKGLVLVPGMPAEAFIQTDKRTVMNYLLKPATDQLSRSFREE